MPDANQVRETLATIKYPGFSRDIVSFGIVKDVTVDDAGGVDIRISFATRDSSVPREIHKSILTELGKVKGLGEVRVDFDLQEPPAAQGAAAGAPGEGGSGLSQKIPGVRRIVAVASGKGGVGKSTVSANLAAAFAKSGLRTGLCDCDLYGPSVAHMFGSEDRPNADAQDRIIPIQAHGVQLMSMGFLLDDSSPVIVRGPLANRYTQQFLRQVAWDNLDVLVVDLPPGTGDIQLTVVQSVALDGAVIVTTPQEVALIDARKASSMFAKVNVPVLGIVENMSWFSPPGSDERYPIFGEGGGAREAERLGVPLLGQVPIEIPVREGGDEGLPAVLSHPDSESSAVFVELAAALAKQFELA